MVFTQYTSAAEEGYVLAIRILNLCTRLLSESLLPKFIGFEYLIRHKSSQSFKIYVYDKFSAKI